MMKAKVELTVFDWHNILKVLETQLTVINIGRFSGLTTEQLEELYIKIANQLNVGKNEPE